MSQGPRWPTGVTGRRVLLECDDTTVQDGVERVLRESGYAVAVCCGPATRIAGRCPLVHEGRCGLVEEADVVVHALDPSRSEHREVLAAIEHERPRTPVVVEVTDGGDRREAELLAPTYRVRYPMSRETLLSAVDAALADATPRDDDWSPK